MISLKEMFAVGDRTLNKALSSAMRLSKTLSFLTFFFLTTAYADSERIIDYEYDDSGNIISMQSNQNLNPPVVSNLSPSSIRKNSRTTFTVTGSDLNNLEVATGHSSLTVSNIISDSTITTFDLLASDATPLGSHTLTLSTRLGSVAAQVEVLPELPIIITIPAPITMEPGGEVLTLDLFLTSADIFDHTLNISVADPNIASVNVSSVTIFAGETKAMETIQITSNNLGFTSLDILSSGLKDEKVNLFVTDRFTPDVGTHSVNAKSLSVFIASPDNDPETTQISPLVSSVLSVNLENSTSNQLLVSSLISPVLSLQKGSDTATNSLISPLVSPVLSLQKESESATGSVVSPLVSPIVSIQKDVTP